MTTFKQIEANRRNALKSTGPTSAEGKQRSRCNAVRHGLTAETVIVALENAEDYKAFEAAITTDYDAQSAVERELVLRLASLLWRIRRATRQAAPQLRLAFPLRGAIYTATNLAFQRVHSLVNAPELCITSLGVTAPSSKAPMSVDVIRRSGSRFAAPSFSVSPGAALNSFAGIGPSSLVLG